MSVSSHLNPEPERRLWIMHGNMRRAAARADVKLGALAVFALMEIALLRVDFVCGALSCAAMTALCAVLPLCLLAVSPFLDSAAVRSGTSGRPRPSDSLVTAGDLAKYPQMELVIALDKYLGGGVTATPYYEDIVGQISLSARLAVRKELLLKAASALALAAQLLLAVIFSLRLA